MASVSCPYIQKHSHNKLAIAQTSCPSKETTRAIRQEGSSTAAWLHVWNKVIANLAATSRKCRLTLWCFQCFQHRNFQLRLDWLHWVATSAAWSPFHIRHIHLGSSISLEGIFKLQRDGPESKAYTDDFLNHFLDQFLLSRIGSNMLLDQHLRLIRFTVSLFLYRPSSSQGCHTDFTMKDGLCNFRFHWHGNRALWTFDKILVSKCGLFEHFGKGSRRPFSQTPSLTGTLREHPKKQARSESKTQITMDVLETYLGRRWLGTEDWHHITSMWCSCPLQTSFWLCLTHLLPRCNAAEKTNWKPITKFTYRLVARAIREHFSWACLILCLLWQLCASRVRQAVELPLRIEVHGLWSLNQVF